MISSDKDDIEYMIRKLIEKYKKWGLTVSTQKTKYLYIGAKAKNLVIEGNKEVRTCKKYNNNNINNNNNNKINIWEQY